jgi:hypothetical protein
MLFGMVMLIFSEETRASDKIYKSKIVGLYFDSRGDVIECSKIGEEPPDCWNGPLDGSIILERTENPFVKRCYKSGLQEYGLRPGYFKEDVIYRKGLPQFDFCECFGSVLDKNYSKEEIRKYHDEVHFNIHRVIEWALKNDHRFYNLALQCMRN